MAKIISFEREVQRLPNSHSLTMMTSSLSFSLVRIELVSQNVPFWPSLVAAVFIDMELEFYLKVTLSYDELVRLQ